MLEILNAAPTQKRGDRSRRESRLTALESSTFWPDLSLTGTRRSIQSHSCLFQQFDRMDLF
jgi:hypothetical protein